MSINHLFPRTPKPDTCFFFEAFDVAKILGLTIEIEITECICLSGIDGFLSGIWGLGSKKDEAKKQLTKTIDNDGEDCSYPPYSVPECQRGDQCGFKCTDGYTKFWNQCVCDAPKKVCPDGKCKKSCPSNKPHSRKRSMEEQYALGHISCPDGKIPCGGLAGPTSYECLDTRTALDSCGGCVFPLEGGNPTGRDCSAITGVRVVQCVDSRCAVGSCMPGWNVTTDASACAPSLNRLV